MIVPPQILLPIFGTDLEGIITTKAITSSLISNIRNEITGDRLFLQFSDLHPSSFVYLSIALTFAYGEWKFNEGSQGMLKLQKLDKFTKKEIMWKNIILIIFYVFTKDVLSAS